MMEERYQLSIERIRSIAEETTVKAPYDSYFLTVAKFFLHMEKVLWDITTGTQKNKTLEELQAQNHRIYREILPEFYETSFANPDYAEAKLGKKAGRFLSLLYTEMRAVIPYVFEAKIQEIEIRMELFLEIYLAFCDSFLEYSKAPEIEVLRDILYWYVSDYSEPEMELRVREQLNPAEDFAVKIIMDSDLTDLRYLYQYGEYISCNEYKTAEFLNTLPEEEIEKIASVYTEGYRIGFIAGNKDLSRKKTVNIRFSLGFERVIRKAISNFREMGLTPTVYRAGTSLFTRRGTMQIGYFGGTPNRQFVYDHKEDEAFYYDRQLMNRKLEILREAYEKEKTWADVHGGPACMEVFGEKEFEPVNKKSCFALSENQQKLSLEYAAKSAGIVNAYCKGEERSFTMIAFPVPEIGRNYEEIFRETVAINTLDSGKYQRLQQKLIDVLDEAAYVTIKGQNGNETDLTVQLMKRKNPKTETVFENCAADVNIPVGEVFTSPKLTGTNGILMVKRVFLNGLEYRNLRITFENGKTATYSCSNFSTKEENESYIKEHVLCRHDALPMGEFAIGTNTAAYVMAKKYEIEEKLPILIAEKTGPHFALGDTCYSHSEEVKVYNPDGKEVIAKDNELSLNRKTDETKAYFNCHTDITIPYEELGSLQAVTETGEATQLIKKGRFVLEGLEELNLPFQGEVQVDD